jgi:hypothetical protein
LVFENEIAISKLIRYKSPSIDQILAQLIQTGCEALCSEIHNLINFIWAKEELPEQWRDYYCTNSQGQYN